MKKTVDIIFAEPLDSFVKIEYDDKLISIDFIKPDKLLKEKRTHQATFELEEYFLGKRKRFTFVPDISGLSQFQQKVLKETLKIDYGKIITYSQLAKNIKSNAYRAVGGSLGKNPFPVVIPCHRVVAKGGIGGYSGGLDIKKKLLELEEKHSK